MYGKVNEKIDVFAFGVVLLELLSGRKPISNDQPKGQESLVMWAKPLLNGGKISKLLDPSLGDNYDHDQLERMVLAATLCVRHAPRARPQISLVSPFSISFFPNFMISMCCVVLHKMVGTKGGSKVKTGFICKASWIMSGKDGLNGIDQSEGKVTSYK
uniref:Uncharacterized protein MANES_18G082900 n=1 Tax=Rhizophora mucronata TaxID=61149 RepID=A0A2P2L371_RHIMU